MLVWEGLTPFERRVVVGYRDGSLAVTEYGTGGGKAAICRAEVITQLIKGIQTDASGSLVRPAMPSLAIQGVRIEGQINLSDERGGEHELHALLLEDCIIPEPILLRHARIARISLVNCAWKGLDAPGCHINGAFEFTLCRPFVGEKETEDTAAARIDLRGARIDGLIDGCGSVLRVLPREAGQVERGRQIMAFNLKQSFVKGSIMLCPRQGAPRDNVAADDAAVAEKSERCRIFGGLSLDNAVVEGDVWLQGAKVTCGESSALLVQNGHIKGVLGIDVSKDGQPFEAEGDVWLMGVTLGGGFQAAGAKLRCSQDVKENVPDDQGKAETALNFCYSNIGSLVHLNDGFVALGHVSFHGAKISGNLDLTDSHIACVEYAYGATFPAVHALNIKVSGDIMLGKTGAREALDSDHRPIGCIIGDAYFDGADIGGSVSWDGLFLHSQTREKAWLDWIANRARRKKMLLDFLPGAPSPDVRIRKKVNKTYIDFALDPPVYVLSFRRAKIDGALSAVKLTADAGAIIDLRGCHAAVLADNPSVGWGMSSKKLPKGERHKATLLRLAGFTYDRIEHLLSTTEDDHKAGESPISRKVEENTAQYRNAWLKRQYPMGLEPDRGKRKSWYEPGPYVCMARSLLASGEDGYANEIERERLRLHRRAVSGRFIAFFQWIFAVCFGSGYSPLRAVVTLTLFLMIGWPSIWAMKSAHIFVIDTQAVAVAAQAALPTAEPSPVTPQANGKSFDEIPCGDEINALLYTADLAVPLVQLHQVQRCQITHRAGLLSDALRVGLGLYSFLGWIALSLALITFSGIARRLPQD